MSIKKLVNKVIPPSDYQHRNGFNNIPIIDGLNGNEKQLLENELIDKLILEIGKDLPDTLLIETLAYLKSVTSLPILKKILEGCNDPIIRLSIATSSLAIL